MINLLFLSDVLGQTDGNDEKLIPPNVPENDPFYEYMFGLNIIKPNITETKYNSQISLSSFLKAINLVYQVPTEEKYIIFYETLDSKKTLNNILSSKLTSHKKIVSDLKISRCSLILFYPDVADWHYDKNGDIYFDELKQLIKSSGIENKNIKFILNETLLNKDKKELNLEHDFKVFNRFATNIYKWIYGNYDKGITDLFNNSRGFYRQFKFVSFNNNIKDHRVDLLMFLIKNNLLENGITSFFGGVEPKDSGVDELNFENFETPSQYWPIDYREIYGDDVVNKANQLIPYSYDLKVHKSERYNGLQDYLNITPHFNSYFNIITESNWGLGFDGESPQKIHITEKTFKSLVTYLPFILVSTVHNLRKLKEWGFKTFHPFIDESYDELETYEERRLAVNKEILRLTNMSRKELDDWYWSMEDILIYNYKHFFKFTNTEYNKIKDMILKSNEELNQE